MSTATAAAGKRSRSLSPEPAEPSPVMLVNARGLTYVVADAALPPEIRALLLMTVLKREEVERVESWLDENAEHLHYSARKFKPENSFEAIRFVVPADMCVRHVVTLIDS